MEYDTCIVTVLLHSARADSDGTAIIGLSQHTEQAVKTPHRSCNSCLACQASPPSAPV